MKSLMCKEKNIHKYKPPMCQQQTSYVEFQNKELSSKPPMCKNLNNMLNIPFG